MILHRRTHPVDVPGCFGCRVASVNIGQTVMETRRPDVARIDRTEKKWEKDFPAYKSMRKQGIQPRTSEGAHKMMVTAKSVDEIEGRPKLAGADVLAGEIPKADR